MKAPGLVGVIAGDTAISTVGKEGLDLTYRGYSIRELADHATFEEVAHLLIHGSLPNTTQLASYCESLRAQRKLSPALKTALEQLPSETPPHGRPAHRRVG